MKRCISIIVIDDSETDRILLSAWFMENPKIKIDRSFCSIKEFLCYYRIGGLQSDLIVVDFYMPVMNGLELCDNLPICDKKKVLLMSNGYPGPLSLLLDSNIGGFVRKEKENLILAAKKIISGERFFDLEFIDNFHKLKPKNDQESLNSKISAIEIEIINLLSCGLSYKGINGKLPRFSERTIETYVQNIKKKVGIHTNLQLIKWAMVMGYIYYFEDI